MIVDSSALLAILLNEPDASVFAATIAASKLARMPAPNWLEVALVIEGRADDVLRERFDSVARDIDLVIAGFLPDHAAMARRAWRQFGRGRHPARLNYGDCMAYGFAKVEGEPLLFKGKDFPLTDIEPALKG